MAASDNLVVFVGEALRHGASRAQVRDALQRAAWDDARISAALGNFAEVEFPIPVPRPVSYVSPRDAFLYLLLFTTLFITGSNLGSLLFSFIDRAFPDPATAAGAEPMIGSAIRWSVSSLIVGFPVFLYVSLLTRRATQRDPGQRASAVRRWLTYLTLFVAACILIGDVIALINGLLAGELTIRFVLKVLTVGGIAGAVFTYYLWDVRDENSGAAR